jgi:hypothetical protein
VIKDHIVNLAEFFVLGAVQFRAANVACFLGELVISKGSKMCHE